MPVKGLKVCTPTSISYSGTSASINSDGSVSFSACTSLSLNGVFTSDYDNYVVNIRTRNSITGQGLQARLRDGSTDNVTASSYVAQYVVASSTSVVSNRSSATGWYFGSMSSNDNNGDTIYLFGPYLAQPTAARNTNVCGDEGAQIIDRAGTHNQSVAYNGITFSPGAGNFTGLLTVSGWVQ
jgi:hypothetical protein